MFKKILIGLAAIIVLFLGYVAIQPTEYTVAKEVTFNTAPDQIFPYINNPQKMDEWNPWIKMDPEVQITYSGPEEGVNAKSSWEDGKKLGTGSATIVESIDNKSVKTQLEFIKPRQMSQISEITLTPIGEQTVVKWSASGKNDFIGRAFCTLLMMNKKIEKTFEEGLNTLKAKLETTAK